ncbi:hypothetical protein BKA56DRAFT_154915 [Ilyonectria sp. MPI-CAGE-AT-0026]|nr:hypothetical protein BKA56DRAFT_154915 [Ilyonectria sp. MPI-CAGE-AT-0026]
MSIQTSLSIQFGPFLFLIGLVLPTFSVFAIRCPSRHGPCTTPKGREVSSRKKRSVCNRMTLPRRLGFIEEKIVG